MKASTLLAITAALLLALGAAVSARTFGWFRPTTAIAAPAPVVKVLVARQNLYENIAITPEMLMVRDLRPDEVTNYNTNRDKFLPPQVEAGALRTPLRNIEADQPILKTDLLDLAFPDGVPLRLSPGTRAVNISVPADRSAGGLITRGDRVDVLLTSRVCDGDDCGKARTLTAFIARDLKIIVKRNALWPVLRANPPDQPIAFTLEANPYRAALIEFALDKGTIALLPASAAKGSKNPLAAPDVQPASFSKPGSPEYQDEDDRVEKLLRGDYSITEADLERIFRLKAIVRTPPPPPPPSPVVIQNIRGLRTTGQDFFDPKTGAQIAPPAPTQTSSTKTPQSSGPVVAGDQSLGYVFHSPSGQASPTNRPGATKPGKG